MKAFYVLVIASSVACQELPVNYNIRSIAGAGAGMCPDTQNLIESIKQDVHSLIHNSVLPVPNTRPGYGTCGCGGAGWRRVAYLNMSDPTQTCSPAWELITTPRRSCARPSNAGVYSCYSVMFPNQGIQYSQVCGRIIGYQFGHPQGFHLENHRRPQTINGPYVDGVSLTYGSPRQHIWTFAVGLDETEISPIDACPCDVQTTIVTPLYVGNDYFCETGVPPGQRFRHNTFYADDPLWDGQGCGSSSTCCTFNNPPWFCKQLPQSTNADLEVRLCNVDGGDEENMPVELLEIYVK